MNETIPSGASGNVAAILAALAPGSTVELPIDIPQPDPANENVHPPEQIEFLQQKHRRVGQQKPITITPDGLIRAGEGWWRAMKANGAATIKCYVSTLKPGEQDDLIDEFRVSDNLGAKMSQMNPFAVMATVERLGGEQFDPSILGFVPNTNSPQSYEFLVAQAAQQQGGNGTSTSSAGGHSSAPMNKEQAKQTLQERFGVPPFSILDARQGYWQERKRAWLALGIKSEVGRGANLLKFSDTVLQPDPEKRRAAVPGKDLLDKGPGSAYAVMKEQTPEMGGKCDNPEVVIPGYYKKLNGGMTREEIIEEFLSSRGGENATPHMGGLPDDAKGRIPNYYDQLNEGKTHDEIVRDWVNKQIGKKFAGGVTPDMGGKPDAPYCGVPDYYRMRESGMTHDQIVAWWIERAGNDASLATAFDGTSIFDPVVCEIAYRWFCPPGGLVVDPFAGGSVRGIVAARLGRRYFGSELRAEQVEANRAQLETIECDPAPLWSQGDSRKIKTAYRKLIGKAKADFIFSCPPYGDLEQYSEDADCDISAMSHEDFLVAYRKIVSESCALLNNNRFAVFVVGDFRSPEGGYRNFIGETVKAFQDAGLLLYNEAVLVQPVGSLPVRVGKQFASGRKLGKCHQNLLVFCKGDWRQAVAACGEVEVVLPFEGDALPTAEREGAPSVEVSSAGAPAGQSTEYGERLTLADLGNK